MVCSPEAAELFIERSREGLELSFAGANGVLLANGERFGLAESERSIRACPSVRE